MVLAILTNKLITLAVGQEMLSYLMINHIVPVSFRP